MATRTVPTRARSTVARNGRKRRSMWVPDDLAQSIDLWRRGHEGGALDFQAALMTLARRGLAADLAQTGGAGRSRGGLEGGEGGLLRALLIEERTTQRMVWGQSVKRWGRAEADDQLARARAAAERATG